MNFICPVCIVFSCVRIICANVAQVNYGYFLEPAGHLWTYGVNAHTWTDFDSNTTFQFTYWPQTSGGKVIKKLQTGELDFAHLGNAPWGTGALRGVPAKMIYVIHSKDESQVLVSHQGIKDPLSLKGKRVAYIRGSTTHYMLELLFSQLSLTIADLDFYGHMSAAEQKSAWDKGEIDAGFMWGGSMRYLQDNPWCSSPDPSSAKYRVCDANAKGLPGYNLFTAGLSKRWGKETWNNLVVRNAFAATYPKVVDRVVKVNSVMDTQLVEEKSYFTLNSTRLCSIAFATWLQCDSPGLAYALKALSFDVWLPYATQPSASYMREAVPGQCELESIPSTTGTCTRETMSGSAWSTWATAEFGFKLKNFPYLPSHKYFQTLMDSSSIAKIGTSDDLFPDITPDLLANTLSTMQAVTDPAHSFCSDLTNPIMEGRLAIGEVGEIMDHRGGGFYKEIDGSCVWHIEEQSPVLLFNISVRIETDQDNLRIYEGLCITVSSCESSAPLLARYTGGKGMSDLTMENLNPRSPLLALSGNVTIIFQTDGVHDRPLNGIVQDGISLMYKLAMSSSSCDDAPCQNGGRCVSGRCECMMGWFGADCSSSSCLGTQLVSADASVQKIVHGALGTLTGQNLDCRWVITAPLGEIVVIEFVKMDLDWLFDKLVFYDGAGVSGKLLGEHSGYYPAKLGKDVGQRCPGSRCPGVAISPGNVLTVQFTSDSMASGAGFELAGHSALASSVQCGIGPVANCSSHGKCNSLGCKCDSGWYGNFCHLRECVGSEGIYDAVHGTISNMDASLFAYSPLRDCSWSISPRSNGLLTTGAIAFSFIRFDLENYSLSEDELTLGLFSFKGLSPPCSADIICMTDNDCNAGGSRCVVVGSVGRCECQPYIVTGVSAQLIFKTDRNDYPFGKSFKGFEIEYHAVYDCPRKNNRCLSFDQCAEFQMVPTQTSCAPCDGGTIFKNLSLAPICDPCPSGRFAAIGQARCSVCSAGRHATSTGQSECKMCERGTFSEVEASFCEKCPKGYATPFDGQGSCQRCNVGTFSDMPGRENCTHCQGDLTTQYPGALSEAECACGLDHYRDLDNRLHCHACLEGMTCPFGADPVNFGGNGTIPEVKQGFYTEVGHPLFVYLCLDHTGCPGGAPGSCSGGKIGLACSMCPDNQYYNGEICSKCEPLAKVFLGTLIIALIFGIIFMYYFSHTEICNDMTSFDRSMVYVTLLVTIFQLMGSLKQLPLPWPTSSNSFLEVGAYFVFDLDSLQAECFVGGSSANVKFTLQVIIPYLILALVLILQSFTKCISQITRTFQSWNSDRVANLVGQISQTLFISFASIAAKPFQCFSHPNGEKSVASYPQIICGTAEYTPLVILTSFLLLTFVLPFFVLTLWANWTAPSKSVTQHSHMVRYFFLLSRFRCEVWWWGSLVSVRQLFFAFSSMVEPDDAHAQILYVVAVLWAYVALALYFWPWKGDDLNVLDSTSLIFMALFVITVGAFAPQSADPGKYKILMAAILGIVFASLGFSIAFSAVRMLVKRFYPSIVDHKKMLERKESEDLAFLWQRLCFETVQLDGGDISFLFLSMSKYSRADVKNVIDIFSSLNTDVLDQTGQAVHNRRITNTVSAHMKDLATQSTIASSWKQIDSKISGSRGKDRRMDTVSLGTLFKQAVSLGASADDIECALDDSGNPYAKLVELIRSREEVEKDADVSRQIVDIDLAHIDLEVKQAPIPPSLLSRFLLGFRKFAFRIAEA